MEKTTITALRICDALPSTWGDAPAFRVHSVFQHACNVCTPQGELWALQTRNSPLAPLGVTLACDDLRRYFSVGMVLARQDNDMVFPGGRLLLRPSMVCSTRLHPCGERAGLARFHQALTAFLASQPPKGIAQALHADAAAIAACDALKTWLRAGEGDITAILRRLVGWGEGLTPSGDDFLLGVLLVLENWRYPPRAALAQALPELLHRTTDVSRAMLQQGCAGHYSARLLQLMASDAPGWSALFAQIIDYGHSSGMDMLSGMALASGVLYQGGEELLLN